MDELKNLVIQSLETNGVLGQVRAQLRSCVFKTIDNQDQVESGKSSFHFENPKAKGLRGSKQGTLVAELIQEFMEFYRLDYSLAVFKPEVNLKSAKANKAELASKAGITDNQTEPILLQLLNAFNSGAVGSAGGVSKQFSAPKEEIKKIEPLSFNENEMPAMKAGASGKNTSDSINQHLAKANNLLAEIDREDGFNLRDSHDDSHDSGNDFNKGLPSGSKLNGMDLGGKDLHGGVSKEKPSDDIGDNYDDDFDDDDIEEDLPADQNDYDDADLNARSATNVANSGQGITVSQSLGVDPSVDSLALEDYDHVEPVERLA